MGQKAERKWNMKEMQGWMIVGLVGGLITIVSLAMPWTSIRSIGASGWELLEIHMPMPAPYLLLFGGILSMIGAAVMLWRNTLGLLLPIGGILALLGWIQGINEVYYLVGIGMVSYGFGVGVLGLLMILVSSFGLRKSKELAALLKVLVIVLVLIVLMYTILVITREHPLIGPLAEILELAL